MREKIKGIYEEVESFTAAGAEDAESFRIKYLSKKGILSGLFDDFKKVTPAERKEIGILLNDLKTFLQNKYTGIKESFESSSDESKSYTDLTLPADFIEMGSRHPMSLIRTKIIEIFSKIGFTVAEGREIEDDWHNFTALNFAEDHPARDMQDTFFIQQDPDIVLRTHTSSVQIRVMETEKPPIRKLFPGRVYRNETVSSRAHCFFHQVEGLYVDRNVSFADLRQLLIYFAKEMFGGDTKIRLRPSYFPFTEPSAEMDISCFLCGGKGCAFCKHSGWVEILGCGMVDPNVFENCHIDSEVYTGYAFGMGIERVTNLKYRISDIRLFSENDIRFLKQFSSVI